MNARPKSFLEDTILTAPPSEPTSFVFYLVPGFSMLAVSSAVEVLQLSNQAVGREAFRWRLVSEEGAIVRASCGLSLSADGDLASERQRLDRGVRPFMAIACADLHVESHASRSLRAWLRECRRRRVQIGALGTAPYLLARAGLLENRRCTIHWQNLPAFAERFMRTSVDACLYEVDDGIWTCAGGTAPFDMMLHLIEPIIGARSVARVCEQALIDRVRVPSERQRLPMSPRAGVRNANVVRVVEKMAKHLSEPLSLQDLAAGARLSRRQLERLFRQHLNCTPARYYVKLRLERAKLLLRQSEMPVVDIAISCGFVSASHFARTFRLVNGVAPQALRRPG